MIKWPATCARCDLEITDWADAGLQGREWLHKPCWRALNSAGEGAVIAELRSPIERSSHLELPMMVFLMMFHFGLAAAVAGWFLLTQTDQNTTAGYVLLVAGLIIPSVGAAGAFANIVSRRRIELIRHDLDSRGGWKPGR